MKNDVDELVNIVRDDKYREIVEDFKRKRDILLDQTMFAQQRWAPLIGEENTSNYKAIAPYFTQTQGKI